MAILLKLIQKLRKETGAGMLDCKKALGEAGGDFKKAREIIRKKGQEVFKEKQMRQAREGVIGFYIHSNFKIASVVKVYCETDFVARNEEFRELARNLAMQVVAAGASYVKPKDIPSEELERQKKQILKEFRSTSHQGGSKKKPAEVLEKIIAGKLKKYQEEICLLTQPFFKNPDLTIQDLISEKTLKLGEKIEVGEFMRFEL